MVWLHEVSCVWFFSCLLLCSWGFSWLRVCAGYWFTLLLYSGQSTLSVVFYPCTGHVFVCFTSSSGHLGGSLKGVSFISVGQGQRAFSRSRGLDGQSGSGLPSLVAEVFFRSSHCKAYRSCTLNK